MTRSAGDARVSRACGCRVRGCVLLAVAFSARVAVHAESRLLLGAEA
jgi:hypothetical protein